MDVWMYTLICPVNVITSITSIIMHFFDKDLRKSPGDLIAMISLG